MSSVSSFYSYWTKSLPWSPTKNKQRNKKLQPFNTFNQGRCTASTGHCNAPEILRKKHSHISYILFYLVKQTWPREPRQWSHPASHKQKKTSTGARFTVRSLAGNVFAMPRNAESPQWLLLFSLSRCINSLRGLTFHLFTLSLCPLWSGPVQSVFRMGWRDLRKSLSQEDSVYLLHWDSRQLNKTRLMASQLVSTCTRLISCTEKLKHNPHSTARLPPKQMIWHRQNLAFNN